MPSAAVLAALDDVERAQAKLRRALLQGGDASAEQPISIKVAAEAYGCSEKSMQRLARRLQPEGGAMKISGAWYVYESLLIRPNRSSKRVSASLSAVVRQAI